jgi:hypothetical protein
MTNVLAPTNMHVSRGDDAITLTFTDNADRECALRLERAQLAAYVALLVKEVEADQVVPIDQDSLRIGEDIEIQGWQVEKHTGGARCLVLFAHLPDQRRTVSIPLTMYRDEVTDLIDQLY